MIRLLVLVILVNLLYLFPAEAKAEYSVGFVRMETIQAETKENIPIALVYPSDSQSKPVKFGPFKMELAINGEIATGEFPVAIISHGSGGTNLGHRSIAFELVKQGFVVAMPLHPRNNFKNNVAEGTALNWINRPKHIISTIDSLLSNSKISPSIDVNRISVIGHSAGGYTALAVAGGTADTGHIIDLCSRGLQLNEPFCGLVKENQIDRTNIDNQRDRRVAAVVLMAPVGILFDSEESLAQVDIPVLLLRAEKDGELTEPYQSEVIAKRIKNKENLTYRTIVNAGHYSFITPFPDEMQSELGVVAEDPEGFDRREFHSALGKEIASFLIEALR